MTKLLNWAGNLEYSTDDLIAAQSVAEVQSVVKNCESIKVLGTRHCFNDIADSTTKLLSLREMKGAWVTDSRTITVEGGISYGELFPFLEEKKLALHNLASLPHISIVGACVTATHGSGDQNGNLATAVSGLEFVTAEGDLRELSRDNDGEEFLGAVVNLGALGVITKLTLDVGPTFQVQQDVYENLPMEQACRHFDAIMAAGYSVSLFTDWQNKTIREVWLKRKVEDGATLDRPREWYGATLATEDLHPIAGLSAANCTEQRGIPGPWYDRLPHFRVGLTPSVGEEIQAEYFVDRRNAVDAMLAVERLKEAFKPLLMISELRTIAADNLWMSPCYKRSSLAIHFTWVKDEQSVMKVLPVIERELAPFQPRPHWGKLFTLAPAEIQSQYERLDDFRALLAKYDPKGKFRNRYLHRTIDG